MIEHLKSRYYDPERYPTQWMTEDRLTVPLHGFDGAMRGFLQYTPAAPKKGPYLPDLKYFPLTPYSGRQFVWGFGTTCQRPNGLFNRVDLQGRRSALRRCQCLVD